MVSGESTWQSGSGGAEFYGIKWENVKNVVFDGLRGYRGEVTDRYYAWEMNYCSDITLRYCTWCGAKPNSSESNWGPFVYAWDDPNSPWTLVSRGLAVGNIPVWEAINYRIKIQHCMFHYLSLALYMPKMFDSEVSDCLFTDQKSDHMRTDGMNSNFKCLRNVFYRTFPIYNGVDVDHSDAIQSATITEPGWQNHLIEDCIVAPGDSIHGKMQGFFMACNKWPTYPQGYGATFRNCLMNPSSTNALRLYPSDRTTVENVTMIACTTAGRPAGSIPPDTVIGILLNVGGSGFGNSTARRNIYHQLEMAPGDTVTQNIYLPRGDYASKLVNYAEFGAAELKIVNPYQGILDLNQLARLGPKLGSTIHPDVVGYHIGCSALFETLGILA